uniref:UBA domain-containing protein n=1 Tax=Meloidogyne incognita TaxID=6306 RepID=A0A914LPH2_MELIC
MNKERINDLKLWGGGYPKSKDFFKISVYSRCLIADDSRLNGLSNEQFIEQCCTVLHFEPTTKYQALADTLKTEALKTLASIVFLEKTKKIQFIVDTLGLKTYHGFCPSLLRNCIERLKAGKLEANGDLSASFVTSLFSLVYHVAGFEYGGTALNRSSLVPVLLGVVKTYSLPEQYISYVTRSVRIIDILTGIDVAQFNSNGGTDAIIKRFSHEVDQCKTQIPEQTTPGTTLLCSQQRAALMKSLLNFIKRAVIDANLAVQMRRIMETEFPQSLIFIIQHSQYFGSSLLHCTVSLITNFIYQEPAQLTMLQNMKLTDALMNLIFDEKLPISRDLVCALPNVCSALCLNERGHNEFKLYNNQKPLEKIFRIIFSNKFLLSMRKRKTEILETAHMLGTSFDELIRHHPALRKDVMGILSEILEELLQSATSEDKCVSWSMGKAVIEDDSVEHVLLGDYMAIMGVMIETILSNRNVQDNIQTINELNIPVRLVKLLSEAKKPNPVLLNSSYLPNLANILCCILRQTSKVDDAFSYLLERCSFELSAYSTEKECQQERLFQLTRLSSLINTMNILMKSVIHAQGSYDSIRPLLLHHFATDDPSRVFIDTLFDTYKSMSSKLLANDKIFNAARQTTSQILEDTTKVRDLLRIDDDQSLYEQRMEVDSQATTVPSSSIFRTGNIHPPPSMYSVNQPISFTINIGRATTTAYSSGSDIFTNYRSGPTNSNSIESNSNTVGTTSEATPASNSTLTERSLNSVVYRCHRQISELITCIGKIFCNASVLKVRQRLAISLQLSHETIKKDFRNVSTLILGGVQRLLQTSEIDSSISALYFTTPLNFLKKFLIDDINNIQQLLPDFYLSGCYKNFFALVTDCFKSNITKEEFTTIIHSWLNIAQKFSSPNLATQRNGAQQQPPQQRITVDGFELKNFLAIAQKDTFSAICSMLKELMKHCETFSDDPSMPSTSTSSDKDKGGNEQAAFKLLEKLLEFMKGLLKDMMKLLELTEGKAEAPAEIPVGEIDPAKIQQLVEMGFSQSDAVDALLVTSSVPEAAEHLVSMLERNPTAPIVAASAALAEELASNAIVEAALDPQLSGPKALDDTQKRESTLMEQDTPLSALKPLNRDDLQERVEFICKDIVTHCLRLLNKNRSVVLGLAELITIFAEDHLARSWVDDEFIGLLINELSIELDKLSSGEQQKDDEYGRQFSSLLHLFCLVWQNFPNQKIYKRVSNDRTST